MINFVKRLFKGRDLREVLDETRTARVHGVKFTFKRIDPMAHLTGSKVMLQSYDEYKIKKDVSVLNNPDLLKQTRDHYRDVFLQCVMQPKLCRKPEEAQDSGKFSTSVIPVDHLLTDWGLAVELYTQIITFTYGKKKVQIQPSI